MCGSGGWRSGVVLVSVGLLASGCGQPRRNGTAQGSTTAGSTSGSGGGSTQPGTGASALGPELELTSPARASWLPLGRVMVEGRVTARGGAAVREVKAAGLPATVQADGTFRAEVPLVQGLNTLVVEAFDDAGGRTSKHVSVIAGETAPEDALVDGAAAVRVTDLALDSFEATVAAGIEAQKAALRQQVLATPVPDVRLTSFDFGRAAAEVDCVPGGARAAVMLSDVALGIEAKVSFLFFSQTYRGVIRASQVRVDAATEVTVVDGQPSVRITQVSAASAGFSVPDFASDDRAKIQQQFQQAFANAAGQNLVGALQQAFSAAVMSGRTRQMLLGRELDVEWQLQSLRFDADGFTGTLGANVAALQRPYGAQATGSVARGGALPQLTGAGGASNVGILIHEDALNRTLHAAWRAGAFQNELDQLGLEALVPGAQGALTTSALMQAVPQLAGKFQAGLPLKVMVEAMLPPVVMVPENGQAQVELAFGELAVKLQLIDPQSGPVTLLDAVCAARVPARLSSQGGLYRLDPAGAPELLVDVNGEVVPGVEALCEQLAAQATGPAALASLARLQGIAIPAAQGLRLDGVSLEARDHCLALLGRIAPN